MRRSSSGVSPLSGEIAMPTLALTTTTHKRDSGSFFKAIKRMLAGENFFINHYTAATVPGDVFLAATMPGAPRRRGREPRPPTTWRPTSTLSESRLNEPTWC